MYLPSPRVKASAPEDSRTPIVIEPLSLIFFSVSWAWAAPVAPSAAASTAVLTQIDFFM